MKNLNSRKWPASVISNFHIYGVTWHIGLYAADDADDQLRNRLSDKQSHTTTCEIIIDQQFCLFFK